jgi:hypothetical protein
MADILLYNAIAKGTRDMRVSLGEPATAQEVLVDPLYYTEWPNLIPKLATCAAEPVCVYDNVSGYFRCGGCCLWTVPAGATKVRFELWGAGSGSGAANCCGHYPWGPNGAYASVIMTAVPGCQYTLCAGCAHCYKQYCCSTCDVSGGSSYVTGFGLTNLCAQGGCGEYCTVMSYANPGQPICRYQGLGQSQAGMCICGGWSMCFSNSCASCAALPRAYIPTRTYYGSSTTGTVFGIPSMSSADCWNTDNYGCICSAPVLLPNGNVSAIICDSYSSGQCCGNRCAACTGAYQWPGLGGAWTHSMGGNTDNYGDWGRTGMVKVSWC